MYRASGRNPNKRNRLNEHMPSNRASPHYEGSSERTETTAGIRSLLCDAVSVRRGSRSGADLAPLYASRDPGTRGVDGPNPDEPKGCCSAVVAKRPSQTSLIRPEQG